MNLMSDQLLLADLLAEPAEPAEPVWRAWVALLFVVRLGTKVGQGRYRVLVKAGRSGSGPVLYQSPAVSLFALPTQISRVSVWARSNVAEVYID